MQIRICLKSRKPEDGSRASQAANDPTPSHPERKCCEPTRRRSFRGPRSVSGRYTLTGTVAGRESIWTLAEGENVLGRGHDCEVQLRDPSVSRRHALVRVEGERIEFEDLRSRNGSWKNGDPLEGVEPLRAGDRIQLGDIVLTLGDANGEGRQAPPRSDLMTTRLRWEEVGSGSEEVRESGAFLDAVIEAAQFMVLPTALEEILPSLLDLVASVVPTDRILLLLWHEEDGELELVASRPPVAKSEPLPLSQTLVDEVLRNRDSVLVVDAPNDPQFAQAKSIAALNLQSAMAAPLFDNEQVIGLIYAHDEGAAHRFDRKELRVFTMLANLIAIKITNARLLEQHREKLRLEHEMAAAGMIQRRILPGRIPEIPGYAVASRLVPCRETGGDFYDVRVLPGGKILLAVGDVSGKGSGAALLTSLTLSAIRVLAAQEIELDVLGARLNEHVFEASGPTTYVTLWLGILDPASHRLVYLNAGHNPPQLLTDGSDVTLLTRTGLPIGMLEEGTFGIAEVTLPSHGLLCVYTDGLVEARRDEDLFGEERLQESFSRNAADILNETIDAVFGEVEAFQEDDVAEDDCTLLLVRRLG
ncbi:MAG: SpoIIE family protein phosphatase [Candidatus Eisenbacteria bacterium]|uniref:SpoIIE family protein phosphatase n=1 Tax=Eiseniibacteriota bacterium TaxID=2212470 RepID=A0A956NAY5_UNCEI|nr:SpoIIE family protein phosphatase [Candidatus Eisenbacteria bacterium]MCB9466299.1 SpoIIE family protein phosphatase [Candidatus Eisenbacteria bacterium]